MRTTLNQLMHLSSVAHFNAGNLREAWRHNNEYYFTNLEARSYTHIGRATLARLAILCILNNAEKACSCAEHSLLLDGGMLKKLLWAQTFSTVQCLPLFRSGREEDANALMEAGMAGVVQYHSGPWFYLSIHTFLSACTEQLTKAVSLRKINKGRRLMAWLDKCLTLLDRLASKAPCLCTYSHYWRGVAFVLKEAESRAISHFQQSIALASAPGSKCSSYPATLSTMAMARMRGTLSEEEMRNALLKRLQEAGDLRSIAILNEENVESAAEVYNEILDETIFSDLFEGDQLTSADDGSSSGGSLSSSTYAFGKVYSTKDENGHDDLDQMLDESFFTGREEELGTFSKFVHDFLGGEARTAVQALAVLGPSGESRAKRAATPIAKRVLTNWRIVCTRLPLRFSPRASTRDRQIRASRRICFTLSGGRRRRIEGVM